VSVATTFTLPAQPAGGTSHFAPLGGDGFSSPFGVYTIIDAITTGDAGGGHMRVDCVLDERYCSVVSFIAIDVLQATPANATYRQVIFGAGNNPGVPNVSQGGELQHFDAAAGLPGVAGLWVPPGLVLGGTGLGATIRNQVDNVLDDDVRMNALIYLFDITVRQRRPMGPLLWNQGSGSSMLGNV